MTDLDQATAEAKREATERGMAISLWADRLGYWTSPYVEGDESRAGWLLVATTENPRTLLDKSYTDSIMDGDSQPAAGPNGTIRTRTREDEHEPIGTRTRRHESPATR